MKFLEGITPREYQQKIFETCIRKNCLVVLPTGLGKTLIALMLSIERLQKFPNEKIVFLAPTRPLAEQHLISFKKHLPELFGDMQLFTGAIVASQRKKIWQTADIIFSTPQCVANDLKNKLYNLNDVCLLIEDEAHRCVKNYDYNYVAKKYKEQSKNQRILGLTASPGSEALKIKEICKNLSIEEVELRTRNSDDVKEYLQELEFEKIVVKFPPEFEEMKHVLLKLFHKYVEELRNRKVLFGPASKIGLIKLQNEMMKGLARGNRNFNYMLGVSACAQAIKIQHALELLETQTLQSFNTYLKKLLDEAAKKKSRGVIKLVVKSEFNFVFMQSNELLAKNQEHPKLGKLTEIVKNEKSKNKNSRIIVFTQFRESATIITKNLNEIEGINAKVFVGQAKKAGTGLSQKDQKKIIEEFSEGRINVLVATCIAEEGLDIPEVNSVIFYEPVPSAIRSIQRSGRTARLMKGKLIILITKGTRDETFYYTSRSREKKMHKAIDSIKDDLENGMKWDIQRKLE
ncbi:MAG: DEAD/DEAH box helicase [Nanoarchaeota archaeon]|nr:DEAD/DEAH box helicase [Nanoarchaeota archaeon]